MRVALCLPWGRVLSAMAVIVAYGVVFAPATADAGSLQFASWTFDRGNAKVVANPDIYADYRDEFPELVTADGGQSLWVVEYDLELPADATYTLHVRYGSPEPRPLEAWLDGRSLGTCCGRVTGNAPPYPDRHPQHDRPRDARGFHGVEWEEALQFAATAGRYTLKFTRQGPPPRLSMLRIETPTEFPEDWQPQPREVNVGRMAPNLRRIFMPPGTVNVETLRMAIEDVTAECGDRFPNGPEYLARLAELTRQQAAAKDATPEVQQPIEDALKALQREALLAHPLLDFDKLLFVRRESWGSSHIYNDYGAGGDSKGGNICIVGPATSGGWSAVGKGTAGEVTEIAPQLLGGRFGQFDLSFDAERVVFAYSKDAQTNYRIYETGVDGTGLRQITFDGDEAMRTQRYEHASYGRYFDMDPCYLPGGDIMFVSTRSRRAVSCHPSIVTSIHVTDADGRDMRCLSGGQFTELDPRVLDDGRVIYMRWEYVDKGFGNVQSLWSMHPDGSYSDHVYKNNVVLPAGMVDARSIPGSQQIVTIGAAHGGASVGPVILVDNRRTRRTADAMTNLTPEIGYPGMGPRTNGRGVFRHPFPLSEKLFLISHDPQTGEDSRYGIYVLDAWGNRALLHGEPETSCYQPVPLRPRRKPTEVPAVAGQSAAESGETATMFIQDVYRGMTGIERGRVKYVRVMEVMPTTWQQATGVGAGMQVAAVSYKADVGRKMIHGITPVHEDGSACFSVPANANLFFQALDENYMELQRMRTFINLMPGEKRSCIGCHEPRRNAPDLKPALAMRHGVQSLAPQPGDDGPRMVHYESDVQPVLDKYCVRCHRGEAPQGELDLSGELTNLWNRSYMNLIDKELVSFLDGGFGSANVPAEAPLTFGSHRSTLVERLREAPCKADGLTREEFVRIVTWIDADVPYYGTHEGKKQAECKDEPDFRPVPLVGK